MFQVQLNSKEEVKQLKEKLRQACDEQGIRLGKEQYKTEAVLASLFGVKDYNTLLGLASTPFINTQSSQNEIRFNQLVSFVERVNVPTTTGGTVDKVIDEIKSAKGIKLIVFAITDGELNNFATSILIVAESGSLLFEQTLLTAERRPRELELIRIFSTLKELGLLSLTRYIPFRIEATSAGSSDELAKEMVNSYLERVFPDWKKFLSMYVKDKKQCDTDVFAHEYWNEFQLHLKI